MKKYKLLILFFHVFLNVGYSQIDDVTSFNNLTAYLKKNDYASEVNYTKADDSDYEIKIKYKIVYESFNDYSGFLLQTEDISVLKLKLFLFFDEKDYTIVPLEISIKKSKPEVFALNVKVLIIMGILNQKVLN